MANQAPDRGSDVTPSEPRTRATSDLIGLRLTLYLGVAIIAILAAFFFVGPVAGIIVLLAAVVLGILGVVAVIRRADESRLTANEFVFSLEVPTPVLDHARL